MVWMFGQTSHAVLCDFSCVSSRYPLWLRTGESVDVSSQCLCVRFGNKNMRMTSPSLSRPAPPSRSSLPLWQKWTPLTPAEWAWLRNRRRLSGETSKRVGRRGIAGKGRGGGVGGGGHKAWSPVNQGVAGVVQEADSSSMAHHVLSSDKSSISGAGGFKSNSSAWSGLWQGVAAQASDKKEQAEASMGHLVGGHREPPTDASRLLRAPSRGGVLARGSVESLGLPLDRPVGAGAAEAPPRAGAGAPSAAQPSNFGDTLVQSALAPGGKAKSLNGAALLSSLGQVDRLRVDLGDMQKSAEGRGQPLASLVGGAWDLVADAGRGSANPGGGVLGVPPGGGEGLLAGLQGLLGRQTPGDNKSSALASPGLQGLAALGAAPLAPGDKKLLASASVVSGVGSDVGGGGAVSDLPNDLLESVLRAATSNAAHKLNQLQVSENWRQLRPPGACGRFLCASTPYALCMLRPVALRWRDW